jgi:hypothetical protein
VSERGRFQRGEKEKSLKSIWPCLGAIPLVYDDKIRRYGKSILRMWLYIVKEFSLSLSFFLTFFGDMLH